MIKPWYVSPDGSITLYHADCIDVFPRLSGLSSIVVDGPSGTGFMDREWDKAKGSAYGQRLRRAHMTEHQRRIDDRDGWIEYWSKRFEVARLACIPDHVSFFWSLPRTQAWTGIAVEDAGYRIIDTLTTINGQGWPKSKGVLRPCKEEWIIGRSGRGLMDVEACRVERGGADIGRDTGSSAMWGSAGRIITDSNSRGSLPCNIALGHCDGDGGLQCRAVGMRKVKGSDARMADGTRSDSNGGLWYKSERIGVPTYTVDGTESLPAYECRVACRSCGHEWLALSGGDAPRCECGAWGEWQCPVAAVDAQTGTLTSNAVVTPTMRAGLGYGGGNGALLGARETDAGGGARFFNRLDSLDASLAYFAKCPQGERHMGCDNLYWKVAKKDPFGFVQVTKEEWERLPDGNTDGCRANGNVHVSVKRISAMRHIHRLAGSERPGWHVGDPCVGSGTGALAAMLDGVRYTGTEICEQALIIAKARIEFVLGLSDSAREALRRDEQPPIPAQPIDERQRSLF